MYFQEICVIILSMGETDELRKVFQKRNFYVIKDTGRVFLYALLFPLAVGLIFSYVAVAIAKAVNVEFQDGTNIITQLFNDYLWFCIPYMLITQIVFLCLYFSYNKLNRIDQRACKLSFRKANVWTCLLAILVGIISVFGFITLIEGVFGNLFEAIGVKSSAFGLRNDTVGWYFLNLLIAGLIPPICEELLFRGVIFQGLKEKFKPFTSVLLTALLFALMHQSITQFIYPFILGFVLTVVMDKTNNLLYPILIHAFNNITTITLSFLQESKVLSLSFIGMDWWVYIVGIVAAIVTFVIFFLIYKFYLIKQPKNEVEKVGEAPQSGNMNLGKFPLSLVLGIILSLVMIVINAI